MINDHQRAQRNKLCAWREFDILISASTTNKHIKFSPFNLINIQQQIKNKSNSSKIVNRRRKQQANALLQAAQVAQIAQTVEMCQKSTSFRFTDATTVLNLLFCCVLFLNSNNNQRASCTSHINSVWTDASTPPADLGAIAQRRVGSFDAALRVNFSNQPKHNQNQLQNQLAAPQTEPHPTIAQLTARSDTAAVVKFDDKLENDKPAHHQDASYELVHEIKKSSHEPTTASSNDDADDEPEDELLQSPLPPPSPSPVRASNDTPNSRRKLHSAGTRYELREQHLANGAGVDQELLTTPVRRPSAASTEAPARLASTSTALPTVDAVIRFAPPAPNVHYVPATWPITFEHLQLPSVKGPQLVAAPPVRHHFQPPAPVPSQFWGKPTPPTRVPVARVHIAKTAPPSKSMRALANYAALLAYVRQNSAQLSKPSRLLLQSLGSGSRLNALVDSVGHGSQQRSVRHRPRPAQSTAADDLFRDNRTVPPTNYHTAASAAGPPLYLGQYLTTTSGGGGSYPPAVVGAFNSRRRPRQPHETLPTRAATTPAASFLPVVAVSVSRTSSSPPPKVTLTGSGTTHHDVALAPPTSTAASSLELDEYFDKRAGAGWRLGAEMGAVQREQPLSSPTLNQQRDDRTTIKSAVFGYIPQPSALLSDQLLEGLRQQQELPSQQNQLAHPFGDPLLEGNGYIPPLFAFRAANQLDQQQKLVHDAALFNPLLAGAFVAPPNQRIQQQHQAGDLNAYSALFYPQFASAGPPHSYHLQQQQPLHSHIHEGASNDQHQNQDNDIGDDDEQRGNGEETRVHKVTTKANTHLRRQRKRSTSGEFFASAGQLLLSALPLLLAPSLGLMFAASPTVLAARHPLGFYINSLNEGSVSNAAPHYFTPVPLATTRPAEDVVSSGNVGNFSCDVTGGSSSSCQPKHHANASTTIAPRKKQPALASKTTTTTTTTSTTLPPHLSTAPPIPKQQKLTVLLTTLSPVFSELGHYADSSYPQHITLNKTHDLQKQQHLRNRTSHQDRDQTLVLFSSDVRELNVAGLEHSSLPVSDYDATVPGSTQANTVDDDLDSEASSAATKSQILSTEHIPSFKTATMVTTEPQVLSQNDNKTTGQNQLFPVETWPPLRRRPVSVVTVHGNMTLPNASDIDAYYTKVGKLSRRRRSSDDLSLSPERKITATLILTKHASQDIELQRPTDNHDDNDKRTELNEIRKEHALGIKSGANSKQRRRRNQNHTKTKVATRIRLVGSTRNLTAYDEDDEELHLAPTSPPQRRTMRALPARYPQMYAAHPPPLADNTFNNSLSSSNAMFARASMHDVSNLIDDTNDTSTGVLDWPPTLGSERAPPSFPGLYDSNQVLAPIEISDGYQLSGADRREKHQQYNQPSQYQQQYAKSGPHYTLSEVPASRFNQHLQRQQQQQQHHHNQNVYQSSADGYPNTSSYYQQHQQQQQNQQRQPHQQQHYQGQYQTAQSRFATTAPPYLPYAQYPSRPLDSQHQHHHPFDNRSTAADYQPPTPPPPSAHHFSVPSSFSLEDYNQRDTYQTRPPLQRLPTAPDRYPFRYSTPQADREAVAAEHYAPLDAPQQPPSVEPLLDSMDPPPTQPHYQHHHQKQSHYRQQPQQNYYARPSRMPQFAGGSHTPNAAPTSASSSSSSSEAASSAAGKAAAAGADQADTQIVGEYLKRAQFSNSDRDRLMASYLTCDGLLNDNDHCLERLACEFSDPLNIEKANKLDRAVSSILLGHILNNSYIPNAFKVRLKAASLFGYTQNGKCAQFVCDKLAKSQGTTSAAAGHSIRDSGNAQDSTSSQDSDTSASSLLTANLGSTISSKRQVPVK